MICPFISSEYGGYGLREFAEFGKVVARENNEVDRKHVMPEREGEGGRRGRGKGVCKISRMRLEIISCFLAAPAVKMH